MLPINLPYHGRNFSLQILILLHILPTRNSNLDENDFVFQLLVLVQKRVVRLEFKRQALDIIKPINPNDNLLILVDLLQLLNPTDNFGLLQSILEFLRINPNDKTVRYDPTTLPADFIGGFDGGLSAQIVSN